MRTTLTRMAMGKRKRCARQQTMWVATTDLPTTAAHPFYDRLNRILDDAGFDAYVEAVCAPFYAAEVGRPSLQPGRYFRLLLVVRPVNIAANVDTAKANTSTGRSTRIAPRRGSSVGPSHLRTEMAQTARSTPATAP